MTTWSVVKDDTQENGRRRRYFRYAVFSLAALLVLSLGFVLIPREPQVPPTPPFSEQARASAYSDALSLRAAGLAFERASGDARSGPQAAAVNRAVTLLTVHARALMLPGGSAASGPPASPASSPPAAAAAPSASELAGALQASAARRLKDAETADGGMARLLAGAGTAQLLAAEDIAKAAGIALAAAPVADIPDAGAHSPTAQATDKSTASAAASCPAQPRGDGTSLGSALASAVEAELELVYAYQAALTRLDAGSAVPASGFLAQHQDLHGDAEALGRASCAPAVPQPAGYPLSQAFLAAPATALGALEAGSLPVYGDLVALSEGSGRAWAISALQSAARRTLHWGSPPGTLPGLVLAESELPELP